MVITHDDHLQHDQIRGRGLKKPLGAAFSANNEGTIRYTPCSWHENRRSLPADTCRTIYGVSSITIRRALSGWWRQPDRYDWLVNYVDARGFGLLTRLGVAGACVAIGAWPILMALSPYGVTEPWHRAVSVGLGCIGLASGARWLTSWPTSRQSKVIAVVLNAAITANCALYIAEHKTAVGSIAFTLTASYIACVNTPPWLVSILGLASAVIVVNFINTALDGDPASGLADSLLRLAAVAVVPLTIQMLVQLLADNAVISDIDPLTGLANRRGLDRAAHHAITTAGTIPVDITLTLLDIDNFKSINDTHGHAVGDDVLIALSEIMRATRQSDAAIARIGGEEFVVFAVGSTGEAVAAAERLRSELLATSWQLTASFGIATTTLFDTVGLDTDKLTANLVCAADKGMYIAKHAGGNRIEVVPLS